MTKHLNTKFYNNQQVFYPDISSKKNSKVKYLNKQNIWFFYIIAHPIWLFNTKKYNQVSIFIFIINQGNINKNYIIILNVLKILLRILIAKLAFKKNASYQSQFTFFTPININAKKN